MANQITINKSFFDKLGRLEELVGDTVEDKLVSIGSYAVQISPVDTAAYIESFSIVPKGSGGGRSRTSRGRRKLSTPEKQGAKDEAKSQLIADISSIKESIVENGGAILRNRSPHSNIVEDKYDVFRRTRGRFA